MSSPPRRAIVFSGHLADAPGRAAPRLPASRMAAASARIDAVLGALDAGPRDLAWTQGAAGGDLLFAERALDRGVRLRLLLPLPRDAFVAASVRPVVDGDAWLERFRAVERRVDPADRLEADRVLGPLDASLDRDAARDDARDDAQAAAFVRGNAWLLDAADAAGAAERCLVCLWDGRAGGRGGTGEMVASATGRGYAILRIDTATL